MATLFVKSGASAAALLRAPALAAVGRLALPLRKSKTVQVVMAQLPFVLKRLSQGRAPMPSEIHRLLSHLPLEGLALLSAKCPLTSVQRQVSTYLTTYRHVRPTVSGKTLAHMDLKEGPASSKNTRHPARRQVGRRGEGRTGKTGVGSTACRSGKRKRDARTALNE